MPIDIVRVSRLVNAGEAHEDVVAALQQDVLTQLDERDAQLHEEGEVKRNVTIERVVGEPRWDQDGERLRCTIQAHLEY